MTRSRLNVRLVFVSAALVTTLATGTHLLHAWQMHRHARGQLDRVSSAEALARLYRTRLDQPKRGMGVLERLVQQNPNLAGAYVARARGCMEAGRLDAAAADLAAARKLSADADVNAACAELA